MSFTALLAKMFVLFCFLALGVLCSRVGFADEHTCGKLNKIVLNICAPAMVFSSVLNSEYTYRLTDILGFMLDSLAFNVLLVGIGLGLSLLLGRKHPDRGTYRYMLSFGNCVFMGFPVVAAVCGNGAVFLGAVFSMPFNIISFSIGIMMIGGSERKRGGFWKMLLNPPFLANIVAFLLFVFPVEAPASVKEVLSYLGNMVVPLSMLLIGASLSRVRPREIFSDWRLYAVCAGKLVIAPVLLHLALRLIVADPLFLNVLTICGVMPVATVSQILAAEYGGNPALASKVVFLSTLCSLLTIPILLSLLLV